MNGYVTPSRFASVLNTPICLPQTELRRGRYIQAGVIRLALGQILRVRLLTLHLINVITPGVTPDIFSTPLGLASAGIYMSPMACSSVCLLSVNGPGATALNPFAYREFACPGDYRFLVSNNTSNVDVTVALTGVAKIVNF